MRRRRRASPGPAGRVRRCARTTESTIAGARSCRARTAATASRVWPGTPVSATTKTNRPVSCTGSTMSVSNQTGSSATTPAGVEPGRSTVGDALALLDELVVGGGVEVHAEGVRDGGGHGGGDGGGARPHAAGGGDGAVDHDVEGGVGGVVDPEARQVPQRRGDGGHGGEHGGRGRSRPARCARSSGGCARRRRPAASRWPSPGRRSRAGRGRVRRRPRRARRSGSSCRGTPRSRLAGSLWSSSVLWRGGCWSSSVRPA